jgi:hypothetical protein
MQIGKKSIDINRIDRVKPINRIWRVRTPVVVVALQEKSGKPDSFELANENIREMTLTRGRCATNTNDGTVSIVINLNVRVVLRGKFHPVPSPSIRSTHTSVFHQIFRP